MQASVVRTPAIRTPTSIAAKAWWRGIPNVKATAQPVQAPVTGKGIATKGIRASAPYLRTLSLCRCVLAKSHLKKASKIAYFLRSHSDTRSRNRRTGKTGIIFPTIDSRKASTYPILNPKTASGMDARSSPKGSIAVNITNTPLNTSSGIINVS